jgi:sulfonate transport system ATP-binding protein
VNMHAVNEVPVAVELAGVMRSFDGRRILDDVGFTIPAGQFVALLGASGSGKTTLLRLLSGLDAPDSGTVLVPQVRTIVFQEPRLMPAWRVWRNVLAGLPNTRDLKGRALGALDEVQLRARANEWPATLSGGEAQRVAIARALVRNPDLLLLDEPFAALDALTRRKMQDLVRELCRAHRLATLLVTHDIDEAIRLADRILVLRHGRIQTDLRVNQADHGPGRHHQAETLKPLLLAALDAA